MNNEVITSKNNIPELSVVLLFYRAEDLARKIFEEITRELSQANIEYELILVGNYFSKADDRTPDILKELAQNDPRSKVVAEVKKGMMGWDMRSGLEECTGDHLAVIDGDGQMPMSDIVKVYRVLQVSKYDFVKTYRFKRYDGFYRKTISFIYNLLFKLLFCPGLGLHDVNSKPKIMTREAYNKMNLISNDWFSDAEIMIEALKNDMKIGEVSTIFYKNDTRSTFVPFLAMFEFIKNLFIYRFFYEFIKKRR